MSDGVVKILAIISDPLVYKNEPVTRLDWDAGTRELRRQLESTGRAIELRTVAAATEEVLNAVCAHGPFDIIQFDGHGIDGQLLFEDGRGGGYAIDGARLHAIFSPDGKQAARLAVLSACHSASVAPAFAGAGVEHVIAIDSEQAVLDVAARKFTAHFYPALVQGKTVREAFCFGKADVFADSQVQEACRDRNPNVNGDPQVAEVLKFKLLPEALDGAVDPHAASLFADRPRGKLDVYSTLDRRPESIAARPEYFTGRAADLHKVIASVLDHKLTSVSGIGGMGKSELCREAGRWFARRGLSPGGITFISLGALNNAADALLAIAAGLKIDPRRAETPEALARLLPRDSLLILDELDSLVDEDRAATRSMIEAMSGHGGAKLLLSSRYPTGAAGEIIDLTRLLPPADCELFLALARQRVQRVEGTDDELNGVLGFLDGVPRAIVQGAAQMRSPELRWLLEDLWVSKEEILNDPTIPKEELKDSDSVLVTLNSSYRRLQTYNAEAADFFPYLSLFPAGIGEEGIREIFGERSRLIRAILDRGMVEISPPYNYYYLPSPVRSFARRKLPDDALAKVGATVLRYLLDRITEGDQLITGGNLKSGVELIANEFPNVSEFLNWAYEFEVSQGQSPICFSAWIMIRLDNFSVTADAAGRRLPYIQRALKAAERIGDRVAAAQCLRSIGDVARMQSRFDEARGYYEKALPLFQRTNDRLGEANCLKRLGELAINQSRYEEARQKCEAALPMFQHAGDRLGEANCLRTLGDVAVQQVRFAEARSIYLEALERSRQNRDLLGEANCLQAMGQLSVREGRYEEARARLEDALSIYRRIGERLGEAFTIWHLGEVAQGLSRLTEARQNYVEALPIFQEVGSRLGEANTSYSLGRLAYSEGKSESALQQLRAALEIYDRIGDQFSWARTKALIGQVLLSAGAHEPALAELEPAAEALRKIGHPMWEHVDSLIAQARRGAKGDAVGK